ncbi:MAG: DAHL domain-containing protein [Cyanobacteria bacterium J06623_5]
MKRLLSVVTAGILLLLLTGLLRQTQVNNIDEHYDIVDSLRSIERADLVVMSDVLKTQLSILPNYDALATDSARFDAELVALERLLSPTLLRAQHLREDLTALTAHAETRSILVEDFKSENAVLRNSLSYLPRAVELLSNRLPEEASYEPLRALLSQASTSLLRYALETETDVAQKIEQLISQIGSLPVALSGIEQHTLDNIFRHVRAVLYRQPETDRAIALLSADQTGIAIERLALDYSDYHRRLAQRQNRYRLWLYLVAIALTMGSGYLLWNYRNSTMLKKVNQQLNGLVAERTVELKQTIEKLKRSQSQLVQSEKMSALGQLSAGVAHEINNPINFIHGNVQANSRYSQDCLELLALYALHYPEPAEEIQDFIESIELDFMVADWDKLLKSMRMGTTRVKQIVESLRNFSRLDEAAYKAVDLHEGLDSTLLLLNHQLTSRSDAPVIEVVKNYRELPLVSCYSGAINQVFLNIFNNAIEAFGSDHSSPQITVSTSVVSAQQAHLKHVMVSIADNGSGIPEEIRSKIFDPFFTSKPVGEGTGLGLTVSYQTVVEAHKGDIKVFSTPNEGTEFQIQLPLALISDQVS